MSTSPDLFTRYAPQLARRIQAINLRRLRELGIESFPAQASIYFEWHDEIATTVLATLSHMEKVVEYYRDLAMAAENARTGHATITLPAPPEGTAWKLVAVPQPNSEEPKP